jgi:hypothetical protein
LNEIVFSEGKYVTYQDRNIRRLRNEEHDEGFYSDRMYGWSTKKFNESCQSVFGNEGQYFDVSRSLEDIEKFLQIYFNDDNIQLITVEEIKNAATGFPYWHFKIKGRKVGE